MVLTEVIGKSGEDIKLVFDGEDIDSKGGFTLQKYIDNYSSMWPGMVNATATYNDEEKILSFTKDAGTKGL